MRRIPKISILYKFLVDVLVRDWCLAGHVTAPCPHYVLGWVSHTEFRGGTFIFSLQNTIVASVDFSACLNALERWSGPWGPPIVRRYLQVFAGDPAGSTEFDPKRPYSGGGGPTFLLTNYNPGKPLGPTFFAMVRPLQSLELNIHLITTFRGEYFAQLKNHSFVRIRC